MVKRVNFDTIYLDMKKIFLLIFIFILLFIPQIAHGQDIFTYKDNIPGFTCGVAGDVTGKDKCCSTNKNIQCNNLVFGVVKGLLNIIPPVALFVNKGIDDFLVGCQKIKDFTNQQSDMACLSGNASTSDFSSPNCKCVDPNLQTANINTAIAEMCYKYLGANTSANNQAKELSSCLSCSSQNGVWTGLGCLPLDLNTLITSFVLTTGIGLGGGFALLCIIYAAFMMQSSQGNPEKLKKAQEMITSCIMGLMLIIFSVFIMKLIGVNILRIPGFG